MKQVTLCFLRREDQILLALKKRGFGAGNLNGVGGKLMSGEAPEQAAVREAEEEIGVKIKISNLEKVAELKFFFPHKPEWNLFCHVYITKKWTRVPVETEEMKPAWFPISQLPFESMWADDPHWLPRVIRGEKIKGKFHFLSDNSVQKFSVRQAFF